MRTKEQILKAKGKATKKIRKTVEPGLLSGQAMLNKLTRELTKKAATGEILEVKQFTYRDHETNVKKLTPILDSLNVGVKTDFLISFGTQNRTLSAIEHTKKQIIFKDRKFAFGKIIKNGEGIFKGIRVLRVQ